MVEVRVRMDMPKLQAMNDCREYIEQIYTHPAINNLIGKLDPAELREELKQEMAYNLLNMPCERIQKIQADGGLLGYSLKMLWNMAASNTSEFYKKFRKYNTEIFDEYVEAIEEVYCEECPSLAIDILNKKLTEDANSAHESIIFQKYVELQSMSEVAKYFNIPRQHVFNVIKTTRKQLRDDISRQTK